MTSVVLTLFLATQTPVPVPIPVPPDGIPAVPPPLPIPQMPPVTALPPVPPPVTVLPATPPTAEQFAKSFVAQPGRFEVTLIHPKTGRPVAVCFDLPPDRLKKVTATKHRIHFEYYGKKDVSVWFQHDGGARVKYH